MNWQQLEDVWRGAWKPPERMLPSTWAERNLRLSRSVSAEAGTIRLSRTPYLRGIVDSVCEHGVEEVVFVKPTQVGGTTAQEILLGFWIDNDPGPCMIVKPSEAATTECVKERIRPLLDGSPALARHVSPNRDDNTLSSIKLDSMPIYLGWAGSPQSLASRPCRYILPDECDKYPPFAGRESDPLSLAAERTATYLHRKRIFKTSTPTTRDGAIWRAWEACGDRRHFFVPCPQCGKYQRLLWPQVKWPKLEGEKIKVADQIERDHLAWYECENPDCRGRIEESHKPKMLERGVWLSETQSIRNDGTIDGERPVSRRVGFHLSSLYSPWRKFWEMAAEFIRAAGDIAATMNFRNSRLAEPFEVQVSKTEPSKFREKAAKGADPKKIPDWCRVLIATADTQQDHFYYTIRAWGFEYRSQLVDLGICTTFDELRAYALNTPYRNAEDVVFQPLMLLIDSGGGANSETGKSRTNEVYQFALSDPARIKPIKGSSRSLQWPIDKSWQKGHGIQLWNVDTEHCKDLLDRLIGDPDETKWLPHNKVQDDYCQQMASEHKIVDPKTKKLFWTVKSSGAPNHWWDCEVYQCAGAIEIGAGANEPVAPKKKKGETSNTISGSDWIGGGRRW